MARSRSGGKAVGFFTKKKTGILQHIPNPCFRSSFSGARGAGGGDGFAWLLVDT